MNRRTQTIKKILDETEILLKNKGYYGTTMRDIANACGFNTGNFYNYFSSKEEIVYEILVRENKRLHSIIKRAEDDSLDPVEQLRRFIEGHLYYMLRLGDPGRLTIELEFKHLSEPYRTRIIELRDVYGQILMRILQRGVDAGLFSNIDVKVVGYFIPSIIVRTTLWFSQQGRVSIKQLAKLIFQFVISGIDSRKNAVPQMSE